MILTNLGSLITIEGTDNCLGYLMDFPDRGVYDATYGKVEVAPEQAKIHNELLDKAMLEGLDQNCQVGQGGCFYAVVKGGRWMVTTFCGTVVADGCFTTGVHRKTIYFSRNGKKYKGIIRKDEDLFSFQRIS